MSTEPLQLNPAPPSPEVHPNVHITLGGLSLRQSRFLDRYLVTGNATESAHYAGYPGDDNQLSTIGSRLLRSVRVRAELQRRLGVSVASAPEVLATLTRHARADLTDVLGVNGEFSYDKARRKRLLKKLKIRKRTDKDGVTTIEREFEIHDPQAALEKLGRFHKLFDQQATPVAISITIERQELTVLLQQALDSE